MKVPKKKKKTEYNGRFHSPLITVLIIIRNERQQQLSNIHHGANFKPLSCMLYLDAKKKKIDATTTHLKLLDA